MSLYRTCLNAPYAVQRSVYELSGIIGKYGKCTQCQTKWKLIMENQKITGLMLHELPKTGAALYKAAYPNAPLFVEIGKPIALSF